MRHLIAAIAVGLLAGCVAPYPQSSRDFSAGHVAAERARADFRAAREDAAVGDYGQSAYDRAAGSVARGRAESDFSAGRRDRMLGW